MFPSVECGSHLLLPHDQARLNNVPQGVIRHSLGSANVLGGGVPPRPRRKVEIRLCAPYSRLHFEKGTTGDDESR